MLDSTSQLLLRHDVLQPDTWLVNAQDNLGQHEQLTSHFYYANLYARYAMPDDSFAAELPHRSQPVVLYVPKEKPLFWMILANLAACLAPNVPVYLVGSNKGGIKSLVKTLPEQWTPVQKVASGNHCLLFKMERTEQPAEAFVLDNFQSEYEVAVDSSSASSVRVVNLPGVFSDQKVDVGTAELLTYISTRPAPPVATNAPLRVLDFACGSGVIGAMIRQLMADQTPTPCSLTACDISAMALHCCALTLRNQALPSPYQVIASDGLNEVSGQYDWIVSNPPFHAGQKTDYTIAEQFFHDAAKRLSRRGRLTIVANSFLGYNELLERHFKHVVEVVNTRKYKIIEASQPC